MNFKPATMLALMLMLIGGAFTMEYATLVATAARGPAPLG